MRILLVQESDWLKRGPHQQHHLMDRLSSRGHEIRVIDFEIRWTRKEKEEYFSKRQVFTNVSKACEGANVSVIRPSIAKIPLMDYISVLFSHGKEIYRQVREFKPDVIIGFGILNTYLAMRMAKWKRIPFIYYLIDALHTLIPSGRLRFVGKLLESETLRQADRVVVINDELRNYAVRLGAELPRVYVVKAGINLDRFDPAIDSSKIRGLYRIGNDDLVLFFMGWLYQFSGLREVAMGLAKVKDEYPNIKLLVVGKGDLHRELQQIKKDCSLQQLILAGWQPYERIPEHIAVSDVCLLPAHNNEVMKNIVPIKMYEYMAAGKPVISTKLLGVMREFGDDNGVIYVNKPAEVIGKAVELIKDGNLKEYGRKARRFVERYGWDSTSKEFMLLLEEVCQIKRQRMIKCDA